jgi:hypothetical protein
MFSNSFLAVPRASGPVFKFCAPGLVFSGIEGVGSRFQVLCSWTHFRHYRGRRLPFSCFTRPDSFSTVTRASGPVLLFYAPGHAFGGADHVWSRFHVLLTQTHFWQSRGRQVPFSCFAPRLAFYGTEGVGSRFNVLHARTHFLWYRGRRLPFSYFERTDSFSEVPRASGPVFMFCPLGLFFSGIKSVRSSFALTDMFSAVPRATGPVFMFCAPKLVFGGTEGVRSRFHILRSQTRFRRFGGRRVSFACFVCPGSFSAETRVSGTVFKFCAPGVVSRVIEGIVSIFKFCALGHVFGGTAGIGYRFHILRARTLFRWYRGCRVPFSNFACPDSFSALPRESSPIFLFCTPEHVFSYTEGVGSRFHVLCALNRFRRY